MRVKGLNTPDLQLSFVSFLSVMILCQHVEREKVWTLFVSVTSLLHSVAAKRENLNFSGQHCYSRQSIHLQNEKKTDWLKSFCSKYSDFLLHNLLSLTLSWNVLCIREKLLSCTLKSITWCLMTLVSEN